MPHDPCPLRAAWRRGAHLVFGATLATSLACTGESAPSSQASTTRDSADVTIVEHDLAQLPNRCALDSTPSLSIGVEEGEPAYMLADVSGAARLSDGRIVIAQRSTFDVRYYDATGTFIRASGRQGRGPGEFSAPYRVHVRPGDTVYVGDYEPLQFLVFAPDGSWLRAVRPTSLTSPRSTDVLADGALILGQENRGTPDPAAFTARSLTIERYNGDGTLTDTVAEMATARYGQIDPAPGALWTFPLFESFAHVYARGDRIVMGHGSQSELRVHRGDDVMTADRIVRWDAGSRNISATDIAAERARVARQYERFNEDMRARVIGPLVSEKRPVADQFPAFDKLTLGTDDRIWIREFPRPADTVTHHWIAFDRDGQFSCRADTPRFADYYEFGADYLLVRDTDALGVERVRQFVLRGP